MSISLRQRRSFVVRLIGMAITISAVAVVVVCAIWIVTNIAWVRELAIDSSRTQAQVIAIHSAAALSFDDPAAGRETLEALRAVPEITAAALYNRGGELFAEYRASPGNAIPIPVTEGQSSSVRWLELTLTQPVVHGERRLGSLVLVYDLNSVYHHIAAMAGWSILAGLLATGLAVALAVRLYRVFTRPVLELVRAARSVSETQDYSVRATKFAPDELGEVTDAFNQMLARIGQQTVELRNAHELFGVAVESAPNGVIMADRSGKIVLVNTRTESLFGYSRADLLGSPLDRLIPGDAGTRTDTNEAKRIELFGVKKNGQRFPIEAGFNAVDTGRGPMVLGSVVDITQRKQAEGALVQLNKELQHRTREMEQFVYIVSHDLKSPIVTINGFIGVLSDELAAVQIKDAAEIIRHITDATARMRQLIEDLLELSRIGRVVQAPEEVDVSEIVSDMTLGLKTRFPQITIEIQPGVPRVWIDRNRLHQVMDNLIVNACKYGCTGGDKRVTVGGRRVGQEMHIFVRDYGQGIAPEYHKRIFGLFQRLQSKGEGTGIGLTIVERIMQLHGGNVWLESAVGEGSTFWCALPIPDDDASSHSPTSQGPTHATDTASLPVG